MDETGMDDLLPADREELELAELVSRVLDEGVVLKGELVVSVADVDLLYLGLEVLLSSVERLEGAPVERPEGAEG